MVRPLAHEHLADRAVGDVLLGLIPLVARSGLRSYLQHALGLAHGVDQLLALLDGVAHGLFEVHVFAAIHGFERDLGVPVVGGCDDDRVHVRAAMISR